MALDEALMAGARNGLVTLRFYGWSPPCLSFGRNQQARGRYDPDRARRQGIDIVRRPTGGRAVLHRREITYSVTAPAELWGGLRRSYRRVNRGLARGLAALGVPLDRTEEGADSPGPERPSPPPAARACFRDPLPGELTSGGRKLVGSAQWRADRALLQHGSILLHDDQSLVEDLRLTEGIGARADDGGSTDTGATSIHQLLGRLPPLEEALARLAAGLAEEFEARLEVSCPQRAELRAARALESIYRSPDWTWRR